MPVGASKSVDAEKTRIMLGPLESVGRGGEQSQRRLASELGVAVGLVNAYLRRCINKGLVKVRDAPARRYAYYLTPNGFAEKSRLTVEYLSTPFRCFDTRRRTTRPFWLPLVQAGFHALRS
jgi:DNA-binding MarR family transcriptional regulator